MASKVILVKHNFFDMKTPLTFTIGKAKLALLALPFFLFYCQQKNKKGEVGIIPDSINSGLTEMHASDQQAEEGVLEMAQQYEELSDFAQAAASIQLDQYLKGKGEQFTFFVPTNDAFRSAGIAVDSISAEQNLALKEIILYHIVPQHTISEVWKDELSYTTLNQEDVTITIKDSAAYVNNAQVVVKDIEGNGGVLQVIDKVLIPHQE